MENSKKIITAAFAFMVILLIITACTSSSGLNKLLSPQEQELTGKRLEISFSYDKVRMIASSQFAFWIEDMDGNYINTLYVTQWTAQGGHERRPKSIPIWVSVAQPGTMPASEIDAVSGATPRPGDYVIVWDFTDRHGNPVTGTEFRYFIEATMNNDDDVLYTGVITVGGESWAYSPVPVYTVPDSEYKNMITNVRAAYYPN